MNMFIYCSVYNFRVIKISECIVCGGGCLLERNLVKVILYPSGVECLRFSSKMSESIACGGGCLLERNLVVKAGS